MRFSKHPIFSVILNIEILKMTATEPFKNKLLALKNEFTKRMEAIDKDSRQIANADWSEQASERENDEVHRLEMGIETVADDYLEANKFERLKLKDELFAIILKNNTLNI